MSMYHIVLDDRVSPVFRPLCSVDNCRQPARHILGRYENADAPQGEHSKFGGWLYCRDHYIERMQSKPAEREDEP